MDNYQITFELDPIDNYDKAKKDLMKAMTSIRNLSPYQQRLLAEELVGAANVAVLMSIFHQNFKR